MFKCLRVNELPWEWVGKKLTDGERAAEASFGIGERIQRDFGWGHRQRAALVRHCVLTGFSCLLSAANEVFCS